MATTFYIDWVLRRHCKLLMLIAVTLQKKLTYISNT